MEGNILATERWINLGCYDEAIKELHDRPASVKSTMEGVKLWVRLCVANERWTEVDMMRETLAKHAPEDLYTPFKQAESLTTSEEAKKSWFFSHIDFLWYIGVLGGYPCTLRLAQT